MSDEEEEKFPFFGTPLEPFEDDELPRKKPIPVQDQIATDKQGRRRFHGAFTGGFSAGHYNTVGTPEGWLPAPFKSSRHKKFGAVDQRPEDFMDDEDTEEFGIAPSVLRAKPEYSGSAGTAPKEGIRFSDGPIPGEPVLKSILQPAKETVGVVLLMKMGWRPGQGVGPRLTKLQKKLKRKRGVIGPSLPVASDSEDEDVDVNQLFAPDDTPATFLNIKTDRFGMGYEGLDKHAVLGRFELFARNENDTFRFLDNNKKLAIRGQAFGVGAFEEDDEDIYSKDDISRYDFALETVNSLREKRRLEKQSKKQLALAGPPIEGCLEGFEPAKNAKGSVKKFFPPPKIPPDYQPYHSTRKTRFGPEHPNLPPLFVAPAKSLITAVERAKILDDEPIRLGKSQPTPLPSSEPRTEVQTEKEKIKEPETQVIPDVQIPLNHDPNDFRPFISDPPKQSRYEKYLHFIKIGAKEAFSGIQPRTMSEWEKERERSEFEQAAKLYQPLSGLMAERFARAELPDDSTDPLAPVKRSAKYHNPEMEEAVQAKKYGKLTRTSEIWTPCSLLCKRMNIPEPNNGEATLMEVSKDKRKSRAKFNVFDFLSEKIPKWDIPPPPKKVKVEESQSDVEGSDTTETESQVGKSSEKTEVVSTVVEKKKSEPIKLPPPRNKNKTDFEDPVDKKDLFKAIFCSSEEDSSESEEEPEPEPEQKPDPLRNSSPPRGIFANLDLDKLKPKKVVEEKPVVDESGQMESDEPAYGPSLPTKPVFVRSTKRAISSSSESDEWVERDSAGETKKRKKTKKHKKEKKRSKVKKKKKKEKK